MPDRSVFEPLLLLIMLTLPFSATAEPMRLGDPIPRWVVVRFEVSPSDRPDLLDRAYSRPFIAWFEPAPVSGQIVVRIDGGILERSLFRDRRPVPGSFSDFLWVFDGETGAVLSASFSGTLLHEIHWGFGTTEIEARVDARMGTIDTAGFRAPSKVWGSRILRYCNEPRSKRCTLVEPHGFDAARGYVNAVGYLEIDSSFVGFSTFSALGEAIFTELTDGMEAGPVWIGDVLATTPRTVHAETGGATDGSPGTPVN